MVDAAVIEKYIAYAEQVLAAEPGSAFKISHDFNYLSKNSKSKKSDLNKPSRIIYAGPGKARLVELIVPGDQRAGRFPQHNSMGPFPMSIEVLPSLRIDEYEGLHTRQALESAGFEKKNSVLTKKKIAKIAEQFANLSPMTFSEMMCLKTEFQKRDFEIWTKLNQQDELVIAYINFNSQIVQFFQVIQRDYENRIVNVKHVVCETGLPLVVNQSCIDIYGNVRNVAHVGITGATENQCRNSLERFDDGTVVWTVTDYRKDRIVSGAAAMLDSGEILIIPTGDITLSQLAARNLGAEGIDPNTQKWRGSFDKNACVPEIYDKYIVRREYKAAVRNKVHQIVDGACIPGLMPIFNI